jgi:hypothetical protein
VEVFVEELLPQLGAVRVVRAIEATSTLLKPRSATRRSMSAR